MSLPAGVSANVEQVVPFLRVTEIERSVRYYVDGLGFEMTTRWLNEGELAWCRLELGGAAIMLQEFRTDRVPEGALGIGVSVCFTCRDTLAIYHGALARGMQPSRPFVGNGMWVTFLSDPDGYKLEFHSPTDIAEETEYEDAATADDRRQKVEH